MVNKYLNIEIYLTALLKFRQIVLTNLSENIFVSDKATKTFFEVSFYWVSQICGHMT